MLTPSLVLFLFLFPVSACFRHPHTQVTRVYDSAHNGNGFVGWDPDEGEGGRGREGGRERAMGDDRKE